MHQRDEELLRQYVQRGDEEAFAGLVRRYMNIVYSAALRQVGEANMAEDVAQAVFILLARKAGTIARPGSLPGWLLKVTWYASGDAMKSRARQRRREQSMDRHQEPAAKESAAWNDIAPVLDEAMSRLTNVDRSAILLRFMEEKSVSDVADALGLSEAAASKRISRALVKLRRLLAGRGVTVSEVVLGGALANAAKHAAPAALLSAAKSTAAIGLAKGTLTAMAMTKAKATAVAVLIALLTIPTTVAVVHYAISSAPDQPVAAAPLPAPAVPTVQREVYSLADDQVLAQIKNAPVDKREAFWRADPFSRTIPYDAGGSMLCKYKNGQVSVWAVSRASHSLGGLLTMMGRLLDEEVEGDSNLLNLAIPGDFVFRANAPVGQYAAAIATIAVEQTGQQVTIDFRDVPRKIIVLHGRWNFRPRDDAKGAARQQIDIYSSNLTEKAGGGGGDTNELARTLGDWIGRQVKIEADGMPEQMDWQVYQDSGGRAPQQAAENRRLILDHLCQQTGLTWTEETRTVRRLFVESGPFYQLKPDQALVRVTPPREARERIFEEILMPEIKKYYYGPTVPKDQKPPLPKALVVFPDHNWTWDYPASYSLGELVEPLPNIYPQQIEGDGEDFSVPGDFVCDPKSTNEQRRASLERIVQDQLNRPVTLTFRDISRNVIVLRGNWKYAPAKSPRYKNDKIPLLELYDRSIAKSGFAISIGDSHKLAGELGRWIKKEIVIVDASSIPPMVMWVFNQQLDKHPATFAKVMDHLCEQTGLTWSREDRVVSRLFIEKIPAK